MIAQIAMRGVDKKGSADDGFLLSHHDESFEQHGQMVYSEVTYWRDFNFTFDSSSPLHPDMQRLMMCSYTEREMGPCYLWSYQIWNYILVDHYN